MFLLFIFFVIFRFFHFSIFSFFFSFFYFFHFLIVKACPMLIARAHMQQSQQLQQQSRSQRVGALSLIPFILPGYQWAPQWVPKRTLTVHSGPISGKAVGGPNTVQHSSTVQKHGKHGSGAPGAIVRRGIEERVLTTSENKTTFETNCETNVYFHLFINT